LKQRLDEMNKNILSKRIQEIAKTVGIDTLGFASASKFTDYALIHSKRKNPKLSLPEAETIIVAGIYIGGVTLPSWSNSWYGRTSRLYLSGYFLDIVEPLRPIVSYLLKEGYKAIICDSSTSEGSIVPLKLAAIRAGLGWQGKHSLLVTKKYGTFLALGGIVTNAIIEHNTEEEPNRCKRCNRCQIACPMGALNQPHVLNREKCLSNQLQTIFLTEKAQEVMGNRVADCEICQEVCPWNKKHLKNPLETKLTISFRKKIEEWEALFYLPNLLKITEEGYQEKFSGINTEIPYEVFYRNAKIAFDKNKTSSIWAEG
jgi:epoxyqueuosine reductase QueG